MASGDSGNRHHGSDRVGGRSSYSSSCNTVLHGLVIDGIFSGVGSVLSFLPIIVTLFFFLSMMEDSGYIARVAFFMDKLLRKIGFPAGASCLCSSVLAVLFLQ